MLKNNKMKIALSSSGKVLIVTLVKHLDVVLIFLLLKLRIKNKKMEVVENIIRNQTGGVGVSVAQMIVEKGVDVLITKNVGPRALDVLEQFKVDIFNGSGSAEENIQKFIEGKLKKL